MNGGPQARVSSPVFERSTLITSAPRSASTCPAHGPARMRANSSTRTPANGPDLDPAWAASPRRTRGEVGRECGVVWPEIAVLSIRCRRNATRRRMAAKISDAALDTLFRKARSYGVVRRRAGHRRAASRDLRDHEARADHGELAAAAHRVPAQRGGEAAPRARALGDQSREDAGRAGGGDLRLRPEIHRSPAALLSQQGCAEVVHQDAGAHGSRPRSAMPRCRRPISCSRRARSASTAGRCRASTTPRSMRSFSPTGSGSRISCAISARAIAAKLPPLNPRFGFDEVCKVI